MSSQVNHNDLFKFSSKGHNYLFWTRAEIVKSFIKIFLVEKFYDDLILPEFNKIDYVVLGEKLPIEIQSTILSKNKYDKTPPSHSLFEMRIEKQLKENIERYGKCWFFFDSEYFRYLQNKSLNSSKLNLKWFLEYMKNGSLTVFSVKYDGLIKKLNYEDFEFLNVNKNYSVLAINKSNILTRVLEGHGYSSKEIRTFYNLKKSAQNKDAFITWLKKKEQPSRTKKLGYILVSIVLIEKVNEMLFRD